MLLGVKNAKHLQRERLDQAVEHHREVQRALALSKRAHIGIDIMVLPYYYMFYALKKFST